MIITKDYEQNTIFGTVNLSGNAKKLLSSGEYILVPSIIDDGKNKEVIELSIIHEDKLLKKADMK